MINLLRISVNANVLYISQKKAYLLYRFTGTGDVDIIRLHPPGGSVMLDAFLWATR